MRYLVLALGKLEVTKSGCAAGVDLALILVLQHRQNEHFGLMSFRSHSRPREDSYESPAANESAPGSKSSSESGVNLE
jgi:hypothetical protein